MRQGWVGLLLFGGLTLSPQAANAWYFPEHTELTRLALQDYAPAFVTTTLDGVIAELRSAPSTGVSSGFCSKREREPGTPVPLPPYSVLCPSVTTRLSAVPSGKNACVPYGALAALAGDHANTACGLLAELKPKPAPPPQSYRFRGAEWAGPRTPLALILTEAAQATWADFQDSAPPEVVRVYTDATGRLKPTTLSPSGSLNPRDYVRQLDAALFILDPGYTSRARGAKTHFHDATASLGGLLQQAALGDVNNVLAQLMAHHVRSLALAVRAGSATGQRRVELLAEALMEHAFALHFIEDAFAAGHIATDPAVTVDEKRAQRHDHFNRQGLAVTRALAKRPCSVLDEPFEDRSMGLHPCWIAHGDGFATLEDRQYVTEAVARVQTSFALALMRPDHDWDQWFRQQAGLQACKSWFDRGAPAEGCDIAWTAFLLDPFPEWTTDEDWKDADKKGYGLDWANLVIRRHTGALADLGSRFGVPIAANAGIACSQRGTFPGGLADSSLPAPDTNPYDVEGHGVALLRPILVAWPAARTDTTTLVGGDKFHRGFQLQIAVGSALASSRPLQTGATMSGWIGLGGGVGYAVEGVFPGRANRTLGELNAGVAQGMVLAGSQDRYRTLGVVEVRTPVTALLVYGTAFLFHSRMPLEALGDRFSFGLLGARAYWLLENPRPTFIGWDAEVANLYLGTPGSLDAAASGITATELRVRLGVRSLDFSTLDSMFQGAFFVAAEVTSGYYTTLF